MDTELFTLIPIFFIIAVFYSSAGFGGGSSYLAVMALFPIEFTSIRVIALLCNITVVSGSVYLFYKNGLIQFKRIWPLIILSIPLSYIGGSIRLSQQVFFVILGFTLVAASLAMLVSKNQEVQRLPQYSNGLIGGSIGFLSGLVGIGGGIFLSPVLYLSKWGKAKVIVGTTAFFILVNSISGLFGMAMASRFSMDFSLITCLVATVFIGGQIGSRLTTYRLNAVVIKRITALLIMIVGIRILAQNLL